MSVISKILPRTVKSRILLSMAFIMLVLIAVPMFYGSYTNSAIRFKTMNGMQIYHSIQQSLESRGQNMEMLTSCITHNRAILEKFAAGDREGLLQETLPLWEAFKSKYNVNVFHFHSPPATSFLRVMQPTKHGDDLSSFRQTVVEANRDKKTVFGLEGGKFGLASRAVVPLTLDGKHLGTVEVGIDLNDQLLQDLKIIYKTDISLVGRDEKGFKYIAKTHNLTIPESQYPFLEELFKKDELTTRQINKDGKILVTTYGPIKDFAGKTLAVLAVPMDITEDVANAKKSLFNILLLSLGILTSALVIVYFLFNRLVNKPINAIMNQMEQASRGDLKSLNMQCDIQGINCSAIVQCGKKECSMYGKSGYCWEEAGSAAMHVQSPKILTGEYKSCSECKGVFKIAVQDEFSELTAYFHALLNSMVSMIKDVRTNSDRLADRADALTGVSDKLAAESSDTASRSQAVAAAAEEMSSNMNSVAAATEEAAANVGSMSSATEEIASTVSSIQRNTGQAKQITGQAVNEARDISSKVDELGTAAQDIGKVTETITEISEQTNLLALNATIEAARAGEAGKGFAVVANEIKDLAKQTAAATGEIRSRIEGIQNSTEITVDGIKKISTIITEIDNIVTSIASALEEQNATMQELTTNIVQAGEGIGEVSENVAQSSAVSGEIAHDIAQVNAAATAISGGSDRVKEEAASLQLLAKELQQLIEKYKV